MTDPSQTSMDRRTGEQSVRGQGGFTLIELLVTLTIIALLLGMLMPLLGLANRESKKSATRTVMAKVDTALRLFRADYGPYPYQASYADLANGASWTNRLNYHLGTDIADADRDKIMADGDAAAAIYIDGHNWYQHPNDITYTSADTADGWGAAYVANRMARERARVAFFSGNTRIAPGVMQIPYAAWQDFWGNGRNRIAKPTDPLLSAPKSATFPGLAKDYLRGELPRRNIAGESILDAWNRPLLYICQVVEGMRSCPRVLGDEGCTNLDALCMGLQAIGRTTLAPTDTITGKVLVADAQFLPDLTNLRHSDRRFYAPRGLETEFELWSAGSDGKTDWMRDATVNSDNVSLQAYDKGIP